MKLVTTFILVHGALYGSWGWDKVVNLLQHQGVNAITLDLPGRAGDSTPADKINLDLAAAKVCEVARLQPGKSVLVGHSQGGLVISQAAELCPEKVERLDYLCALLPRDGQTLGDLIGQDKESLVVPNLVPTGDGFLTLKGGASYKQIFCQDCSDRDAKRGEANLTPEPIGIGAQPTHLSEARFGSVPRHYLMCTEDRTVTPTLQRLMLKATPVEKVVEIHGSHSPFLSVPEKVVNALVK